MTQVRCDLLLFGSNTLAKGKIQWSPIRRYNVTGSSGTQVVLPTQFTTILNGKTAPLQEVPPNSSEWCYLVTEKVPGGSPQRYLVIPNLQSIVEYADLVEVDPLSFEPTASPNPAWIEKTKYMLSGVVLDWDEDTPPSDTPVDTLIFRRFPSQSQ